jgi:hypothetical protein
MRFIDGREDLALQRAARTEWDHGQAVAGADGKGGGHLRGRLGEDHAVRKGRRQHRLVTTMVLSDALGDAEPRAKHPLQLVERLLMRRGRRHRIPFPAERPIGAAHPSLRFVRVARAEHSGHRFVHLDPSSGMPTASSMATEPYAMVKALGSALVLNHQLSTGDRGRSSDRAGVTGFLDAEPTA